MPSHRPAPREAKAASRRRFGACLAAACLAVAVTLAGCSGAMAPRDMSAGDEREGAIEQALRREDGASALRAADAQLRRGADTPRLWALRAAAHSVAGDAVAARRAGAALAGRAAAGDAEALRSVEQLAAWWLSRRQAADAVASMRPLWPQGCEAAAHCDLAARLLLALPPGATRDDHAAVAAPRAPDQRRSYWRALGRAFLDRGDAAGAMLAARALAAMAADDPDRWGLELAVAQRERGPEARAAWLARVAAAGLDAAALRSLAGQRDVRADALAGARVWMILCSRPDATADDWRAWLHSAQSLAARRADPDLRASLERVAATLPGALDRPDHRRALVTALLDVDANEAAAAILAPVVADTGGDPEAMVLDAELLRRRGQIDAARARAEEALQRANGPDKPRVAALIVRWWAPSAPPLAAPFRALAAAADERGEGADPIAALLQLLGGFRPPLQGQTALKVRLERALRHAGALGDGAGRAALAPLAERLAALQQRAPWRATAAELLAHWCHDRSATGAVCARAAEASLLPAATSRALPLWRRAVALARAEGAPVRSEPMARALVEAGDGRTLAYWLAADGAVAPRDPTLAWRAGRLLLLAGDVLAARPLIAAGLERIAGEAVMVDLLPDWGGSSSVAGAALSVQDAELEGLIGQGAADIVLRHLETLRARAASRQEAAVAWRFGRLRAMAEVQVGQPRSGHLTLRRLATAAALDDAQRVALATLAARLGACDQALDLAIELAPLRWPIIRGTVDAAIACAQATGDRVRLASLADRLQRAHIELATQLHIAERLHRGGAPALAAQWYERLIGPMGPRVGIEPMLGWAETLLELGRPGEADEVIAMTQGVGGHLKVIYGRRVVRLLLAFERADAAVAFADRALEGNGDAELRWLKVGAVLRTDADAPTIGRALDDAIQAGNEPRFLEQVVATAEQTRRLAALYAAVQAVPDPDREVERLRVRLAVAVGDVDGLRAALQRLRGRAIAPPSLAVVALAQHGAWREARALADALLTSPASIGGEVDDDGNVLADALAVRRKDASLDESIAAIRLALARSEQPGVLALKAADLLARQGGAQAAAAVAAYAIERHPHEPWLLFLAGDLLQRMGRSEEGVKVWQRLASLQLASGVRGRGRATRIGVDIDVASLLLALRQRAPAPALGELLALWTDKQPEVPWLWGQLVRARAEGGDVAGALAALQRADRALPQWPEDELRDGIRELLRAGGGGSLAQAIVARQAPLRREPWWLATCLDVLRDHGSTLAAAQRTPVAAGLRTALAATSEGRLWLARHLATHGDAEGAMTALGEAPMLLGPPSGAPPTGEDDDRAAAAVAGAWIASLRVAPAGAVSGAQPLTADSLTVGPEARVALRRQLAHGGRSHEGLIAKALALQGHGDLALALWNPPDGSSPLWPSAETAMAWLQVAAAAGTRELVSALARLAVAAPADRGALFDRAARRRDIATQLLRWGHPQAAVELLASGRRVAAIASPWRGTLAQEDPRDGGLERFELAAASAPGPAPMAVAVRQAAVLLAAGREQEAGARLDAVIAGHDEPWHVALAFAGEALLWRADHLARAWRSAAAVDAPEGTFACIDYALGDGPAAPCLRDRPGPGLDPWAQVAVARAIGRGDPAARAWWQQRASLGGVIAQGRLLGVLAAELEHAPPEARARGAAAAELLVGGTTRQAAPSVLAAISLDELSALGVAAPALAECERAYAAEPFDHGSLNNLAYALLLSGSPAAGRPSALATASLARLAGANAHALTDTLAAIAAARNDLPRALRWQRASLAIAPRDDLSPLPAVRMADLLRRAGDLEGARLHAAWALRQADEHPLVAARARHVLVASLRAQRP